MIVTINSFVTAIAEVLPTVVTDHLVATSGSGDRCLARWALLSVTKYFCDTKKFINHVKFSTLLIIP